MADYSLASLNDGKGTWYARREGCQATSAPDLTIEAAAGAGITSWSRLQNLSSDHIPILMEWRKPYKAETREKKAMPNTQKVDWDKYADVLDRELVTSGEEGPPEVRYEQLVNAIRTAASEATTMRVRRTGEERWMNSEIKRARRERNHYRRDMTRRRGPRI